ncbi:MAG: glycosyltransferase [Muribaculaceae bacterium]|nr:glycosyltransferase [Muribaculaceae bacterium]
MNGSKPIVSVIIPAYNVERFLPEAIESLLSQTLQDWELIISDDCSTDRTFEIAMEYARRDSRIKVIRSARQSGGPFIPRRDAMEVASSDLIAPFDADDKVDTDYLSVLVDTMQRNKADVIFPRLYRWDGEKEYHPIDVQASAMERRLVGKEMVRLTLDGWKVHCGGGVIKKGLYRKCYDELEGVDVIPFIDEYLSRLILIKAGSVFFTEVPYYYRSHPSSVTHSSYVKKLGYRINPRLIRLMEIYYGKDSEEYLLAQRQNFYGVFEAFRVMNRPDYPKHHYREDKEVIKECMGAIDRDAIEGKVNRKYYLLSTLPYSLCKRCIKYIDRLLSLFK